MLRKIYDIFYEKRMTQTIYVVSMITIFTDIRKVNKLNFIPELLELEVIALFFSFSMHKKIISNLAMNL